MQIRKDVDSDIVIAEFSSATGEFTIEDAAAGAFVLEIEPTITRDMTFTEAVYDIECTYPDERISRIIEGLVVLSKEVTRSTTSP